MPLDFHWLYMQFTTISATINGNYKFFGNTHVLFSVAIRRCVCMCVCQIKLHFMADNYEVGDPVGFYCLRLHAPVCKPCEHMRSLCDP